MSTKRTKRTLLNSVIGAALVALLFALVACEPMVPQPGEPDPDPDPPAPPAESTLTYADEVRVIEDDGSIQAVTPDAVEFARPVSYVPGDVLVAGITPHTPSGLIRRVTAVSDDRLTVTTEHATLTDVVEGTLRISGQFRNEHLSPESRQAIADAGIIDLSATDNQNQRTLLPAAKSDFLEFAFGFPKVAFIYGGRTLVVDGDFRFGITYDADLEIRKALGAPTGIISGKFTIEPKQVVNLRVTETNEISGTFGRVRSKIKGELVFPLFPTKLSYSVSIPAPVPLTITPTFQLYLGLDSTGRVTFDVKGTGSVEIGVQCTPESNCHVKEGWRPVLNPILEFAHEKEPIVGDSLRSFMRPEFGVEVGVSPLPVGLYAKVGVDLFVEAVNTTSSVRLDGGLAGYADVGLDAWIADWEHRVVPWAKPNETKEFIRVTIWEQSKVTVPSQPAQPTVTPTGSSSLRVTWSAPADNGARITDYDVRYRRSGANSWTNKFHSGTSRSSSLTGLSENTRYEVQVRAQNSRGESSWSPSGYGTTRSGPTIRVPSRPAAPTVSVLSSSSLRVTWSAPAENGAHITDYDVQFRRVGTRSWTNKPHRGTSLSATITGLSENTRYEVQVRAQNSRGESSWSPSGYGTTRSGPPPSGCPTTHTYFYGKTVDTTITWRINDGYVPPGTKYAYSLGRNSSTLKATSVSGRTATWRIERWYYRIFGNQNYFEIRVAGWSRPHRLYMTCTSPTTGSIEVKVPSGGSWGLILRSTFRIYSTSRSVAGGAAGGSASGAVHDWPLSQTSPYELELKN